MPTGIVKSWIEARGFGHITEDGGEDIFVHRSGLEGCAALVQGDKVQFTKEFDARKQKDIAKNVTGGSGKAAARGTVKSWNEARGFGFIQAEDGGEDLFVHRSALAGGAAWLDVGAKVSFTKAYDEKKEKHLAVDVAVAGPLWGWGPGKGWGKGFPMMWGMPGKGWGKGWW
eukprot:gnl/TRDRNA2_/TRDRNA2_51889_c0_seq1.p2 gnl/TRDRNA2_/TRDRNA2_51889_c0~~gnl/TRDRNA2_/TRDRNA2_51889_c0_seq1.p2  ORF type:complete len:171 (+),score=43.44 gnl/TRDRNA2_/TRDRNA2_51889_c0_seq1:106-618(+)